MYSGAYYQGGNKDGKGKAKGLCGSVNIGTDAANHIYLFGTSYAQTLTSEAVNKSTVQINPFGV